MIQKFNMAGNPKRPPFIFKKKWIIPEQPTIRSAVCFTPSTNHEAPSSDFLANRFKSDAMRRGTLKSQGSLSVL
jgi:hypothetical protein